MKLYETGFLLAPNMTEEEAEGVVQSLAEVVPLKNGKMIRIEKWGKRRMAYAIGKAHEAYYVFFHYEGGAEIPAELARRFRQMDTIIRHLTLLKETQMNVRKKKKVKKNAGPGTEAETASPAAEPKREEA
ncbi:MAG: 30S ribosomal protein S6 [Candidatus Aminicenantes bacterium]|nr:30S ribosomal protein S6 [Candidatus Aminicenantes bacterium]